MKIVLGCIGVVVVGAILLGGCMFIAYNKVNDVGEHELEPVVKRYFERFESQEFAKLYTEIDEDWRDSDSEQEFRKLHRLLYEKLGTPVSRTREDIQIEYTVGSSSAQVVYDTRFEKGSALVTITLLKRGEIWRIQGVNYNSRALIEN